MKCHAGQPCRLRPTLEVPRASVAAMPDHGNGIDAPTDGANALPVPPLALHAYVTFRSWEALWQRQPAECLTSEVPEDVQTTIGVSARTRGRRGRGSRPSTRARRRGAPPRPHRQGQRHGPGKHAAHRRQVGGCARPARGRRPAAHLRKPPPGRPGSLQEALRRRPLRVRSLRGFIARGGNFEQHSRNRGRRRQALDHFGRCPGAPSLRARLHGAKGSAYRGVDIEGAAASLC